MLHRRFIISIVQQSSAVFEHAVKFEMHASDNKAFDWWKVCAPKIMPADTDLPHMKCHEKGFTIAY